MEEAHGRRKVPLVYPAWIVGSDSATKNVFILTAVGDKGGQLASAA